MKDSISLVVPTLEHKDMAIEYKMEHFAYGETMIDGSELWDQMDSYEEWLTMVTNNKSEDTVNSNWVVTDTFLAIRENDGKMVGIIDFRHSLNDFLKDFGHIGYSVRPSERRKGYATEMLHLDLLRAKKCGLQEVKLSCLETNIPSVKTILNNGGIFTRSFQHEGSEADVYRISLVKSHLTDIQNDITMSLHSMS